MTALARLMETLGGDILFAGDLAYDRGTLDEFRRCFDPAYGRLRSRSWAVPGNHEYMTSGATGFFSYFGDRAGPDSTGYYALRIAGWQVLMLNSNVPMTRGSRQYEFVRQQMQAAPRCTLAVWHHPFDSSGPNGPNPSQRDLWELLHNNNADVVVAAHDHLYERHAPMNASGQSDPVRGVRLFISGGGGAPPYQRARAARPVGAPHLDARTAAPQARARSLRVGIPWRERQRPRSRPEHLPLSQCHQFLLVTFFGGAGFGNVPSRIAA